jgi:hypothetical protein
LQSIYFKLTPIGRIPDPLFSHLLIFDRYFHTYLLEKESQTKQYVEACTRWFKTTNVATSPRSGMVLVCLIIFKKHDIEVMRDLYSWDEFSSAQPRVSPVAHFDPQLI